MNRTIEDFGSVRQVNCYSRPKVDEPLVDRHAGIAARMKAIDEPLGWRNTVVPPAPDFGKEIYAGYSVKYQNRRITCHGGYAYRNAEYLSVDKAAHDDHLFFQFDARDPKIAYSHLLQVNAPQVIEAFRAYRAVVSFFAYDVLFEQKNEDTLRRLRADPTIDIDGRNNIFTLETASYWDSKLCQRALGYDRDEVIRRLAGKVPRVEPLMDGVYVVFSDNPDLTFEEYCAYNDALKPVLGLA